MCVLLVLTILLSGSIAGIIVLAVVVASFLLGAIRGVQGTWQSVVFGTVIRPRLGPPAELEDPAAPRFAQLIGLIITGIGLVLGLVGVSWAVWAFAALALVAAFLNAAFGLCLGCELYLLGRRVLNRPAASS